VLRAHLFSSFGDALEEARRVIGLLFADVHSPRIARSFPHELSGGERQRAVIAQALCCRPALLIADEPTASLDSVTKLGILRLLRDCRGRFGMAMLVISHDRGVLSFLTDRLLRLKQGRIEG
jgi:peptide/nickel transport system ATP-binding protein